MSKIIMIGCDLHDRSMLLRYAVGSGEPQQLSFDNDAAGRQRMINRIKNLANQHECDQIILVYEASGLGHGLSDQLHAEGITCFVLSPTHLPKTAKSARLKTDATDAQMLLEQVRGFVLAGNQLPAVWTPPQRVRDDRELVRARIDVADELTRVKLKINSLCKVHQIALVSPTKCRWTKAFITYLRKSVLPELDYAVRVTLSVLVDRFEMYRKEQGLLDKALSKLSREPRYKVACAELREMTGVGLLVAMTFLTEMGDLNRFDNRRQVAAYLGLCPSCNESGEKNDRKGRITRQGPARLRKVLCQAAWVAVNRNEQMQADYLRIRQNQKHRSKKALVAVMRKMAIKMWHLAQSCGVSVELRGRERPSSKDFAQARQRDLSPPSHSPSLQPQSCAG